MGPRPFTFQQATAIVKDFNHLVGKPFNDDDGVTVRNILISPFDEENKGIFVHNYQNFGSRPDALDGYVGHFYDVLVLAKSEDVANNNVQFENIRQYARDHGQSYVFPEYPFM